MTLPLIYALSKSGWLEKRRITYIVRNQSHKPKKVQEVIEYVRASGGIEYATEVMHRFYKEAMGLLGSYEDSSYKRSLQQLLQYTIERNK